MREAFLCSQEQANLQNTCTSTQASKSQIGLFHEFYWDTSQNPSDPMEKWYIYLHENHKNQPLM